VPNQGTMMNLMNRFFQLRTLHKTVQKTEKNNAIAGLSCDFAKVGEHKKRLLFLPQHSFFG
jgi:hypothetical protein